MMKLAPAPESQNLTALGVTQVAHAGDGDGADGTMAESVVLLGPGPGFWPAFTRSAEFADGRADPLDRWSKRVIGRLAEAWGGAALFPSDGPPYLPFFSWALASGEAWASPVGLLCHSEQGLWCSFRGAVRLSGLAEQRCAESPCRTCAGQPCRAACPVSALTPDGYDTAACHAFLDTAGGADCLQRGCAVRRACPVGARFGRSEDQSEFHMRAFHPR